MSRVLKKKNNTVVHMETDIAQIAKGVPRRKNYVGDVMVHDFMLYYITTVIKRLVLLKKKGGGQKDQWNRTEPISRTGESQPLNF